MRFSDALAIGFEFAVAERAAFDAMPLIPSPSEREEYERSVRLAEVRRQERLRSVGE